MGKNICRALLSVMLLSGCQTTGEGKVFTDATIIDIQTKREVVSKETNKSESQGKHVSVSHSETKTISKLFYYVKIKQGDTIYTARKEKMFFPADEFTVNQPVKIRFNWMGTIYVRRPNGETLWMNVKKKELASDL